MLTALAAKKNDAQERRIAELEKKVAFNEAAGGQPVRWRERSENDRGPASIVPPRRLSDGYALGLEDVQQKALRREGLKSTYCGRSRRWPWTPQLGGELPLGER
jgi:surface antigen